MKASRTWLVWAALAICAATILGAMAWQTRNAIASERDRAAAESRADLQERMRLALWRMDTLGASLVLEEENGGMADFIRSRLEWKESGQLTQPDGKPAPAELQRAITQPGGSFEGCFIGVSAGNERWKAAFPAPVLPKEQEKKAFPRRSQEAQQIASNAELQKRSEAIDNVFSKNRAMKQEEAAAPPGKASRKPSAGAPAGELADAASAPLPPPSTAVPPADPLPVPAVISPTRPTWIGDELFLLRSVSGDSRSITGSWVDLSVLRGRLLTEARDLLPAAKLLPAKSPSNDGLVLASFPLRLDPGKLSSARPAGLAAPITLSLVTGWSAALLAILAASFLVFGIVRLSERRASFVSAVTHELRTPLTTFRLYSDMLESNAVKPEKRGDYLRVLSREADRLSHLVENVLAFSRIERGSARSAVSSTRVVHLLSPMRERFEARLATAGMTLRMPLDEPAAAGTVRTDAAALEHILFNLVDNAAKYAAGGHAPLLEISVARSAGRLKIRVADHGPGIPPAEHRRIFRAFHKSAREAAESRPGVGLGLALSRRLARGMGGDLVCESGGERGSAFILSLPA